MWTNRPMCQKPLPRAVKAIQRPIVSNADQYSCSAELRPTGNHHRSIRCPRIDASWNWSNLQRPFFRLYYHTQSGAALQYGDERYPVEPGAAMLVPAWFPFAAFCPGRQPHAAIGTF